MRPRTEGPEEDPFAAAQGIVSGLIIGIAAWAVFVGAVLLLT
jgi:hypothetical protein